MFIKFNFKNQKRKTNASIKTMEELRAKAQEIFGEQVVYCDFMYEDEDRELVALIDDIDLETCFEEATENGQNRINVFLEVSSPKTKNARSMSKKRREGSSRNRSISAKLVDVESPSEGDSGYLESFDSDMDSSPDPISEEKIELEVAQAKTAKMEEIQRAVDSKKSKIEEKFQRKLEKLERKKNKKLEKIAKKKEMSLQKAEISDSSETDSDIPEDKPWMKHIPRHHRARMMQFGHSPKHHHCSFRPHHRHRHHHGPHHGPHHRHHHSHHHGPHHRHPHHRHHRRHSGEKKFRGPFGFLVKAFRNFSKRAENNEELKKTQQEAKEMLHEFKKELKPLKKFPKMLLKVLKKAGPHIKAEIEKAVEETKAEHPRFKEQLEAIQARREETNARREERIAQQKLKREERKAAQALKREQRMKAREERKKAKEAQKEANATEKVGEIAENGPQENATQSKEEKKAKRQAEIRERVLMLLPIYSKKMERKQIRQEVVKEYNQGLPVQETIVRLYKQLQAE